MEIKSSFANRSGQLVETEYRDIDSIEEVANQRVHAVHGFCFAGEKLVIVYSEKKGCWMYPGGGVEEGETVEEATAREVLEETNMRVLKQVPVGTLTIHEPGSTKLHVRSFCIVEPIGPFVADADAEGDITEMKLIDPANVKEYFDWGEVGDHLLARALRMREDLA